MSYESTDFDLHQTKYVIPFIGFFDFFFLLFATVDLHKSTGWNFLTYLVFLALLLIGCKLKFFFDSFRLTKAIKFDDVFLIHGSIKISWHEVAFVKQKFICRVDIFLKDGSRLIIPMDFKHQNLLKYPFDSDMVVQIKDQILKNQ